jgi:N-acetylated-alpha-linked acidic dipeptidase
VVTAFNGYAPSGEAEGEVVYANYGRPEDFKKLDELKVDVRGKIVLVRYGENYRGVKPYVAQQRAAAGVIIYSDPMDDGYFKGDAYPKGPWRPESAVQRGSVKYMFKYPGDPTTPGVASTMSLPESARVTPESAADLPKIPTTPLSYGDARPMLENLGGPESPREWQGALPFTYHLGPGPVRARMRLKQNYQYRSIWNVIGKIRGTNYPDEWVIAGNHRDAWVYGAVDPNSGTAAMLETVHGIGELIKSGWKPQRTVVFGSWDAEEQGLIGSTEWAEEHARELANAAAYFNVDVAVSGPNFSSSAVPSLKQFVREVAKAVPSPAGPSVYDVWKEQKRKEAEKPTSSVTGPPRTPVVNTGDVPVGDLGSGSDYTPFLQHLGVPSTDIGSSGSYGVYHSVFDNFNWFKKFADPNFVYEQQMARILGIQVLRMANSDVLPYDFENYGKEITGYIQAAQKKSDAAFKGKGSVPDFRPALDAARRLTTAGSGLAKSQTNTVADATKLNRGLVDAERALLLPEGLPNRPWFKHAIYAPGEYTGYAAVVIPGVNEAIDDGTDEGTKEQIAVLAGALNRAAQVLETASQPAAASGQ